MARSAQEPAPTSAITSSTRARSVRRRRRAVGVSGTGTPQRAPSRPRGHQVDSRARAWRHQSSGAGAGNRAWVRAWGAGAPRRSIEPPASGTRPRIAFISVDCRHRWANTPTNPPWPMVSETRKRISRPPIRMRGAVQRDRGCLGAGDGRGRGLGRRAGGLMQGGLQARGAARPATAGSGVRRRGQRLERGDVVIRGGRGCGVQALDLRRDVLGVVHPDLDPVGGELALGGVVSWAVGSVLADRPSGSRRGDEGLRPSAGAWSAKMLSEAPTGIPVIAPADLRDEAVVIGQATRATSRRRRCAK